jgi:hypothetical protein
MEQDDLQEMVRAVRQFVRSEVVPEETTIEESDAIPGRIRQQAIDMGLYGFALPIEHGGLGLTMTEEVQLVFELGYTTPAFRSMFIATRACFASTREPARSSNSSSLGRWCATRLSPRAHRPDRSSPATNRRPGDASAPENKAAALTGARLEDRLTRSSRCCRRGLIKRQLEPKKPAARRFISS